MGAMIARRAAMASMLGVAMAPGLLQAATLPSRTPPLTQPDPALWDPAIGPMREAMARGPNGKIYYRAYGREGRTPIVVLHGGPAAGHRYMRPYAALATDRQVVFYDQSGCGGSSRRPDPSLYTVERYVAELEALRVHLGFECMILLGHSWGGMLAPSYAAAHPGRVEAMVLAGTAARWRDFQDAAALWLAELGPDAVATVARAEAGGGARDPAYGALIGRYYSQHLCRLDPLPAWFEAEGEAIAGNPVYLHLNGPSEFQMTGSLASLDLSSQLPTLSMPVLVTCGEYDEAPPWVGRRLASLFPNASLQVFEGLSHMTHIEDPARVVGVAAKFVRTLP